MANPKSDIDAQKLKMLMRLKPTLEDTAAFFECSTRTIERYITREFKLTFSDFREQHMVHTRLNIVRKAIQKAESGDNVMIIFCLKNLCGWSNNDHSTVVQVKAEASVNTELEKKMVQEFKQTLKSYLDERKEPA